MLPPNELKKELLELAKIQLYIDSHGGNEKNGALCDDHLARGLKILHHFGLPTTDEYVELLFVYKMPTDADLNNTIRKLIIAAQVHLSAPIKTDVQILEEAVKEDKPYDVVFGELGITDHIYSQFVYHHILRTKRDSPAAVLEALRKADTPRTMNLLGIVALAKALGEDEKKMMEELYGMGIKYLNEYLAAYRVEDEKSKHHFSQLNEFLNDLMGGYEFKSLDEKFGTLTHYLMNYLYLSVGAKAYRIIELEIYYHDPVNHPDPYVHKAPEQLSVGRWYYNGMGVDITFGDLERGIYGGILIRGIRTIENSPRYISGTINVLREIFNNLGDITEGDYGFFIREMEDGIVKEEEPTRSTRIGLTKKKDDTDNYAEKDYRYLVEVNLLHKFKDKEKVVRKLLSIGKIKSDDAKEIMGYNISE